MTKTSEPFVQKRRKMSVFEFLVLIVIVTILVLSFFAIMSGVSARNRDRQREKDVAALKEALGAYYKTYKAYPICPRDAIERCLEPLVVGKFLSPLPFDPAKIRHARSDCGTIGAFMYCYESLNGSDYVLTYNRETDIVGAAGWQKVKP